MRDRFEDIERDMKKRAQQQGTDDKLDSMEKDLDHLMGRGETSDISGVPTMVTKMLLTMICKFITNLTCCNGKDPVEKLYCCLENVELKKSVLIA